MGIPRVCLTLCALAVGAGSASGQDLVAVAKRVLVASLDSTLPPVPFETSLAQLRDALDDYTVAA
jgi:hypothetical protein